MRFAAISSGAMVSVFAGFTSLSMFPRMWAASGVDYPTLVDRLVTLALGRDVGLR